MHQIFFNVVDMKKKNSEINLWLHLYKKCVFNDDYNLIMKEDR